MGIIKLAASDFTTGSGDPVPLVLGMLGLLLLGLAAALILGPRRT